MEDVEYEKLEVIVLWGPPGTGKSRKAREMDPHLYQVMHGQSNQKLWFDGYQGQETVLFEEFYGDVPHSIMLGLTDGYKYQIEVKGGTTWKQWKRVIFTSNKHPRDWYREIGALKRRFTQITFIDGPADEGDCAAEFF